MFKLFVGLRWHDSRAVPRPGWVGHRAPGAGQWRPVGLLGPGRGRGRPRLSGWYCAGLCTVCCRVIQFWHWFEIHNTPQHLVFEQHSYFCSKLSCLLPVIGWTGSQEFQLTNHRQQTQLNSLLQQYKRYSNTKCCDSWRWLIEFLLRILCKSM